MAGTEMRGKSPIMPQCFHQMKSNLGGNDRYRHLFETDYLKSNLSAKTVRGGASSFIGENLSFFLRTMSAIVLARLLLPEHYGIVSMVTAVTVFADRFKDLGLDIATIQNERITHEQVSTLFWINAGIGIALMLVMSALSPVIAWFYRDKRLIAITLSISSTYFFGGLTIQHQALLRRQMLFSKIVIVQLSSLLLSIIVGLLLAFLGFGYWALVANQVSSSAFGALGTIFACGWLPSRPTRDSRVRSMLRTGFNVTVYNIAHFFTRSFNQVLIGKYWGEGTLGLFVQSEKFISIPMEQTRMPLYNVAVTAMSALQTERERYQEYCRRIMELYVFINIPLLMYFVISADRIILLILGQKWIGVIPIIRVLTVAELVMLLRFPYGFVMLSSGRTKQYAIYGIVYSAATVIAVTIGVRWGAIGAAYGYLASNCVLLLPGLWYSFRKTPIRISLVFKAALLPAVGASVMTAALWLCRRYLGSLINVLYVPISLALAMCSYLFFWLIVPEGKSRLKTYVSHLLSLFRKKGYMALSKSR
jgi:O-antigen/teichoic acid export membrane protein